MNGEIGALYQGGEQVGGFLDWELVVKLATGAEQDNAGSLHATNKVEAVRARAMRFWLLRQPQGTKFEAQFYQRVGGQLALVAQRDVEIEFTKEHPLDTVIPAVLGMIWKPH